jgi:TRAP-type transport system small permease protein
MNRSGRSMKTSKWLALLGGVPLLAAMVIEFVTALGRQAGMAALGSIELIQAAILVSSTSAIVIATLNRSHAKVRVLLNSLSASHGALLGRINAACAALFFLALTAGSAWIAMDMWSAYEQSEILRIPYLPLRCFACVGTAATAVLYLRRVFWRSPP